MAITFFIISALFWVLLGVSVRRPPKDRRGRSAIIGAGVFWMIQAAAALDTKADIRLDYLLLPVTIAVSIFGLYAYDTSWFR